MLLLLLDVVAGMEYLHGEGILHGDLKAANVSHAVCMAPDLIPTPCVHIDETTASQCLDQPSCQVLLTSSRVDVRGWTAKISDFGLSRLLDTRSSHLHTRTHGTVMYAAPELLKDGRLTKAADVYSFGLLGMNCWLFYTTDCTTDCIKSHHCTAWETYTAEQAYAQVPLGQLFARCDCDAWWTTCILATAW